MADSASKKIKDLLVGLGICAIGFSITGVLCFSTELKELLSQMPVFRQIMAPTVQQQIDRYGADARSRVEPKFKNKQLDYPPEKIAFIAIKATKELLIYSGDKDGNYHFVCTYPILGASGQLGPKLKEGDKQVPEGIYQLTLEPDTPYHLALRLNYPNASDLARAETDGRNDPGSDILIHGTTGSVGCIAVGDPASEDLFVLAYDSTNKIIPLIIAPVDMRATTPPPPTEKSPKWLPDLYTEIKQAMAKYPRP